jgi:phosphoribosylformylglycinamidine synthase
VDPYAMAWAAVDEAVRNCVAVGADPDRIALLDNFCWGNPNLPDRLGGLVRCAHGCYDAAVAYGAPFISGKDSLNNEYTGADGKKHAIPGTLLISALGIVPDVSRTVTMSLKAAGDRLYLVGEIASSHREAAHSHTPPPLPGHCEGPQPRSNLLPLGEIASSHREAAHSHKPLLAMTPGQNGDRLATYRALHAAMRAGLVRACHDCSEGGLAVAAAEMVIGGGLGLALRLAGTPGSPDLAAYDMSLRAPFAKQSPRMSGIASAQTTGLAMTVAAETQPAVTGWETQDAVLLFGETLGRLLVEVAPEHVADFEAQMAGLPCVALGDVTAEPWLRVAGPAGAPLIEIELAALEDAWRGHIR